MSDMDKMQTEAVNRAREMYSRRSPPYSAGGFPDGYNGSMKHGGGANTLRDSGANTSHDDASNISRDRTARQDSLPREPPEQSEEASGQQISDNEETADTQPAIPGKKPDLLDTFLADKEKALIIILIALLNEEKANPSLMMALMYLII